MLHAPRDFQIEFKGRTYSGHYVLDGSDLCVGSAYGDRRQHFSRSTDLDKLAKLLLRQILEERAG